MSSPDWQRIREIFEKCVELPPEEHEAFLNRECGDDAMMLNEVNRLLMGDAAKSEFMEWPSDTIEQSSDDPVSRSTSKRDNQHSGFPPTESTDASGDQRARQIGPYKLLQEIGHGGMGTVWLAQQTAPVNRRVALKLVKSALSGRAEFARFEAERQALALMNHPNIAKVFDAGTTEDGVPYYVMEFINGISVTEFCDKHELSIRDRLQVFIPICRAIQHAHQKGVIHRDLKPSNILVAESEGFPVPKVIDFGLAKSIDHQRLLTDKTLFTEVGKVVGTLQYMSPEQAALTSNDIDSRTDIYSLGIILYELLTGLTPLDRQTIRDKAILNVLEIIRQSDTPRPSFRLSSSGETITGVSKQRQIEPRKLQNILRGELDWVVMKALEKDRNRRYDSASSFADDIHRFLINEPVAARPPSNVYRLGKFVARNRLLVSSVAAITLLGLIGFASLIYAYQQSLRAEALARKNEQQAIVYAESLEQAETSALASIKDLTKTVSTNMTGSNTVDTSKLTHKSNDPLIRSRHESAKLLVGLGLYLRALGVKKTEQKKWFDKSVKAHELLEEGALERASYITYATALEHASLAARSADDSERAVQLRKEETMLLEQLLDSPDIDQDYIRWRLAITYQNLGNLVDSLTNTGRAIDLLQGIESPDERAECLLGQCYFNRAENRAPEDAEMDLLRAIELLEAHDRYDDLNSVYNYMCVIQKKLGNEELHEAYRKKSHLMAEKLKTDSPESLSALEKAANTHFNSGFDLHVANNIQGALEMYSKTVQLISRIAKQNPSFKAKLVYYQTYWHRAEAYTELDDLQAAQADFDEAIHAIISIGNAKSKKLLPYLQAKRLRCQAETNPIKAASTLDLVNRDVPHKGEVFMLNAAVYSLAAESEKDEIKKSEWLSRGIEAVKTAKKLGELTPEILREFKQDADYKMLRTTDEYEVLLRN